MGLTNQYFIGSDIGIVHMAHVGKTMATTMLGKFYV